MRLRIVKNLPKSLEGFDLGRFEPAQAYDVNAPLSDLLIAYGYAVPENALAEPGDVVRQRALKAFADAAVPTDPRAGTARGNGEPLLDAPARQARHVLQPRGETPSKHVGPKRIASTSSRSKPTGGKSRRGSSPRRKTK